MALNHEELEIIILGSVLESSREHVARCLRRLQRADEELTAAELSLAKSERNMAQLRKKYLQRAI